MKLTKIEVRDEETNETRVLYIVTDADQAEIMNEINIRKISKTLEELDGQEHIKVD